MYALKRQGHVLNGFGMLGLDSGYKLLITLFVVGSLVDNWARQGTPVLGPV